MNALRFHPSVARYYLAQMLGRRSPPGIPALRLEQVEPPIPADGWRSVDVRLSGICGSDLALLYGKSSPQLWGFHSLPAVLGHEILGEVDGARVVVNPLLSCEQRGLDPCVACRHGHDNLCENIAEGDISPASTIGYCRDLPGGWSERIIAHEKRLHAVPDDVPDERAVLAEPLAVVLHGIRIAFPRSGWPRRILIVGAGTIGLLSVKTLRLLGFPGEIHVVARYSLQAEMAGKLDATTVHRSTRDASAAVGAKAYPAIIGPDGWRGGFEGVIDAAGSSQSLAEAAWAAREGSTVLLLGAPAELRHNFAPYWFREISLKGSWVYTAKHFQEAVELLVEADGLDALATHRYSLKRYREALAAMRNRQAVKAVFDPRS